MLSDLIAELLILLVTVAISALVYIKWKFTYWKRKGVPQLHPSIPMGSLENPLKLTKTFADILREQFEFAHAGNHKHVGMYFLWKPAYLPVDPEIVKLIMSKAFNHFAERIGYYNEEDDPLSAHLVMLEAEKWKTLRAKLTPTFTSGKMKAMLEIVATCGDQLKDAMDKIVSTSDGPIDIKNVLGRFTTNVIGSCAFGLDCNCFEDEDSEFIKYAKRSFAATPLQNLRDTIATTLPGLAKKLRFRVLQPDVSDFFMRIIKETIDYREKNGITRNDFMQMMIALKNGKSLSGEEKKNHENERLTMEEIAAQCFVFFLAGYETSSSTMMFCLYELAVNKNIQEKVRQEINTILKKHDNKITYEGLGEMKYMGQVIDEALRKYPPLPVSSRKCVADYQIPDTDVVIEKGTMVLVPIQTLQNDPKYFPDPERFDPDRFSDENKHNIIPFTYLPFGEGPRNCIGLRFGVMQTKMGLAVMLKNYEFSLNSRTQTPFKMDPYTFILNVVGGVWLDAKKVA